MINSADALEKLLSLPFSTVLDLGAGEGLHSQILEDAGKLVTSITYENDFLNHKGKYDCIWASHVLEHQPNPNIFLKKCFQDLNENGILAVTVPPLKDNIVGGHVTLWNAGLLLYQLILAGFDCSEASVKTYGYNISVIVRKKELKMPELKMDHGDLNLLSDLFPVKVKADTFHGVISEVNW